MRAVKNRVKRLEWLERLFEALSGAHPLTKVLPSLIGGETTYLYLEEAERWVGVIRYERTNRGIIAEELEGFTDLVEHLRREWAEEEGFDTIAEAEATMGRAPEGFEFRKWAKDPKKYSPD